MRIAVVGATGLLGQALIPELLRSGHTVRALARSAAKAEQLFGRTVELMPLDLLAPEAGAALAAALAGCEAALHIATAIPRDFAAPGAWDANTRLRTEGVARLLAACQAAGVRRYVQQSITMAYPDHGADWIDEDLPLDTAPARAQVCGPVRAMEALVRDQPLGRLEWCILRGGEFVGPGTFQDGLIADLRAGRAVIAGDGENFISHIHVADMAAAAAAAVLRAPAGAVFNITAEPVRQQEYLNRLADRCGAAPPAQDWAAARPPSWRCRSRRAQAALGWAPVHPIYPH